MKPGKIGKTTMKIIASVILLILALSVSFYASSLQFDTNEDHGRLQAQLTKKLAQVAGVWFSVKVASGVISFVQTIQIEGSIPVVGGLAVAAQPLGWADVIDNTMDQISNICLWAMGALAVQKLLLTISVWVSLRIVIPVCAVLIVIALWSKKYHGQLKRIIPGIVIISLGICAAIPVSLEFSNVVESSILSSYINQTVNEIQGVSNEIEKEGEEANDVGLLRRLGTGIAAFFDNIRKHFDSLIERTINYIICFVVTNIIIPICTLFFLKYMVQVVLRYIGFSGRYRSILQTERETIEARK